MPEPMIFIREAEDVTQIKLRENGPPCTIFHGGRSPITIQEYGGKFWAGGLFAMHDQEGFSLTDSLIECKKHGFIPALGDFRAHAISAGWNSDHINRTIREACRDSGTVIPAWADPDVKRTSDA